jgi:hypothetical protein
MNAAETFPTEADIDAVLEEFQGDPRAAIRGLLEDIETLAADYDRSVSRGYVRGQSQGLHTRRRPLARR